MSATARDNLEVRHGYTIGDLRRLAAAAVTADRLMASDITDRYDTAWSAIAEHLCAADEQPDRQALVRVGWQAIYRQVRDARRERGYADGTDNFTSNAPTMPRFVMWWGRGITPSHEDKVVERIAARQVIGALGGSIYADAVVALAVHGDYRMAAAALGISYEAFGFRIAHARRQLAALWHQGETPRPLRIDRRVQTYDKTLATHCSKGHEYTPENTHARHRIVRGKPVTARVCRACESERSAARHQARMQARATA